MNRAHDFASLLGHTPGVPYPHDPLLWDRRLTVAANVNTIERYLGDYAYLIPAGCTFDEAAIMVPTPNAREALLLELAAGGWQVFNSASDLVYTNPMSTRYVVEYTFLQCEGKPYRLEVMLLGQRTHDGHSGFSPLHQALWRPDGQTPTYDDWAELPIPHLSFKAPAGLVGSVGPRKAIRQMLDKMTAPGGGFIIAQACQSTYGEFWYTTHVDSRRQVYIKPRANVRDA